jgi:hypothetical protein
LNKIAFSKVILDFIIRITAKPDIIFCRDKELLIKKKKRKNRSFKTFEICGPYKYIREYLQNVQISRNHWTQNFVL